MPAKKLGPKKTAKKQTHFDRMAKQEKQAKQIKELKKESKDLSLNLDEVTSNYGTMKTAFDELKAQHNNLAMSSEKLLKKDLEIEQQNTALKEQVLNLTKANEEAHSTITRLAEEKADLEKQRHGLQETVKHLDEKLVEQTKLVKELNAQGVSQPEDAQEIPESEVKEVPADAGSQSGAV